jgi:hypothetical protein
MDLTVLPADHGLVQKPHEFFAGMSGSATTLTLSVCTSKAANSETVP